MVLSRFKRWISATFTICIIELHLYKATWLSIIVLDFVFPIGLLIFLLLAGDVAFYSQFLVGIIIFNVYSVAVTKLAHDLSFLRLSRNLSLYATQPLPISAFVAGKGLTTLIELFSALILPIGIGFLTGIIPFSVLSFGQFIRVLVILGVIWVSAMGLGFLIGLKVKHLDAADTLSTLVWLFLTVVPPVIYSVERLPTEIQPIMQIFPTMHQANLLRQALLSNNVVSMVDDALSLGVVYGFLIIILCLMIVGLRRWPED